jgi:hypothetical protein
MMGRDFTQFFSTKFLKIVISLILFWNQYFKKKNSCFEPLNLNQTGPNGQDKKKIPPLGLLFDGLIPHTVLNSFHFGLFFNFF